MALFLLPKLLPEDGELYAFAESQDRIAKERSMRRRKLKWLWGRLAQLQDMQLSRDALLMKLGSAQSKVHHHWVSPAFRKCFELVDITYRIGYIFPCPRSSELVVFGL